MTDVYILTYAHAIRTRIARISFNMLDESAQISGDDAIQARIIIRIILLENNFGLWRILSEENKNLFLYS